MALWKPDPTFYPSARMAMAAPPETLAYVVTFDPKKKTQSPMRYARSTSIPSRAATVKSSAASRCRRPATSFTTSGGMRAAPRCAPMRRIRTSSAVTWSYRGSAPRASTSSIPSRTREIRASYASSSPKRSPRKTGYSRPHTIHCGPDAIYVSALGAPNGDGPGGIFLLDHESFDVLGQLGSRSRTAAVRL